MRNSPKPIRDIVKSVLNNVKKGKCDIGDNLSEVWKEITKEELVENTSVINFKKGVMEVKVFNSSYLYKLTLSKRRLIQKINKKLGREIVYDINFRI